MHEYGFLRVASAVPKVSVADCSHNTQAILSNAQKAYDNHVEVVLFPELSISAYTCGDLFLQSILLDSVENSIAKICEASCSWSNLMIVLGAPLRNEGRLFNCAVVIQDGKIMGVVPKSFLPNYSEFYEKRWFASALDSKSDTIMVNNTAIPFSSSLLFSKGEAKIAIEICEDLWTPIPPSSKMAQAGANVILNLSASNEVIGKHAYRLNLISQQSARTRSAYVYSSAGYGESTTDVVFAGNAIICENGSIVAQSKRFYLDPQLIIADVDIERLNNERLRVNTAHEGSYTDTVEIKLKSETAKFDNDFYPYISPTPFIPNNERILNERCEEIINIQAAGLIKRLDCTHSQNLVIGISGGLDSTLALLIAVTAFDRLNISRKGIHAITMPGFGTTDRTYTNAITLMTKLGVSMKEISIRDSVMQHFKDIEHSVDNHDVTYENSQARERTQILMDYANKVGGMVLGTGDLSELALGWATYNGDHMSMYGVNASIPKTLVKHLVRWWAILNADDENLCSALLDIVDTPISPELIPADEKGNIKQKTEDLVGPYELHDFFLYYFIRHGFTPNKIYFLARKAFAGTYDNETIKKWMKIFFRRFFNQQFKRSCMPDGPKVGSISLSPRGDWRMPSDASSKLWLAECETLTE